MGTIAMRYQVNLLHSRLIVRYHPIGLDKSICAEPEELQLMSYRDRGPVL